MNTILHHHLLRSICMAALAAGLLTGAPAVTLAQPDSLSAADTMPTDEDYGIFDYEAQEEPPLFDDPHRRSTL